MSTHWTLTVKAEGDGPPVECRVRRLLKAALRAYGLRCTAVDATTTTPPAPAPSPWTHDQAVAACADVGITEQELVDHLRRHGRNSWNRKACTPLAMGLIEQRTAGEAGKANP